MWQFDNKRLFFILVELHYIHSMWLNPHAHVQSDVAMRLKEWAMLRFASGLAKSDCTWVGFNLMQKTPLHYFHLQPQSQFLSIVIQSEAWNLHLSFLFIGGRMRKN